GPMPAVVAGHSLGEYTALVCAQVIDFPTGVELVAKRGSYMQKSMADKQGSMAAIVGLDEMQVKAICQEAAKGEILEPANYNSPEQIVLAGDSNAVQRAIELAHKANARLAVKLDVSVPCHCSLMRSAALQLSDALNETTLQSPKI